MLTFQQYLPIPKDNPWSPEINREEVLFFDIETTGLSADTSYLYLICCGFYQNDTTVLLQWFSEGIQDEPLLLKAFFKHMQQYKLLVHFNGTSFDMNYLLKKCRSYHLPYHFNAITSLDLYKRYSPFKSHFKLPNAKQKTFESLIDSNRKDSYSGGELIPVYTQYLGRAGYEKFKPSSSIYIPTDTGLPIMPTTSAKVLLDTLLLHNSEDVLGLIRLSSLLPLIEVLEGRLSSIQSAKITNVSPLTKEDSFMQNLLVFTEEVLELAIPLRCHNSLSLRLSNPYFTFVVASDCCILQIPFYVGRLKFFFEDFENYYYLPAEDNAIHKSVAEYVDKAYRKKATSATSYTAKNGYFLPQVEEFRTPAFRKDRKDKVSYFEWTEDLLSDSGLLLSYAKNLLIKNTFFN